MNDHTLMHIRSQIERLPRIPLANLPTPLHSLPRLGQSIGCPDLCIKRDDLTSLALGGNKTRKLEWIMADLLAQGCDTILTWGGWQSNWCRQVAAASASLGIEAHLLLFNDGSHDGDHSANVLLNGLFGAHIHPIRVGKEAKLFHLEDLREIVDPCLNRLKEQGKRVYVVGVGGSMVEGSMTIPLGALAYFHAFLELMDQAEAQHLSIQRLVVTSGSASTQAGLLAGALLCCPQMQVFGVSVTLPAFVMKEMVLALIRSVLNFLHLELEIDPAKIIVHDEFMGQGYGQLDAVTLETIGKVARLEGILLDPVYTGKGMTGLISLAQSGALATGNTLFWHTGGTPALFAYGDGFRRLSRISCT